MLITNIHFWYIIIQETIKAKAHDDLKSLVITQTPLPNPINVSRDFHFQSIDIIWKLGMILKTRFHNGKQTYDMKSILEDFAADSS